MSLRTFALICNLTASACYIVVGAMLLFGAHLDARVFEAMVVIGLGNLLTRPPQA